MDGTDRFFISLFFGVTWLYIIAYGHTEPVKECYKQTTDSKTMLHRIKCEVE